jgi:hypothetical protein
MINKINPIPMSIHEGHHKQWRKQQLCGQLSTVQPILSRAQQWIVTQQAINVVTIQEKILMNTICTPCILMKYAVKQLDPHFEHYANPIVHPITGETISSYKKLMHDPATADIWQTALGKDFGRMAQGDNKTGQKGTNSMFVMNHEENKTVLKAGEKFTNANPVVDHRPQKTDPNRIHITAEGNLIQCDCELLVPTADIDTAKLHWYSVVSTALVKYMCIDIKKKPFSCLGMLKIHEDSTRTLPKVDNQAIQIRSTHI